MAANALTRYGDDGSWSAISIRVGTPPQWVDVMVSTVSSETWVVGPYGCDNSELDFSVKECWEKNGFQQTYARQNVC